MSPGVNRYGAAPAAPQITPWNLAQSPSGLNAPFPAPFANTAAATTAELYKPVRRSRNGTPQLARQNSRYFLEKFEGQIAETRKASLPQDHRLAHLLQLRGNLSSFPKQDQLAACDRLAEAIIETRGYEGLFNYVDALANDVASFGKPQFPDLLRSMTGAATGAPLRPPGPDLALKIYASLFAIAADPQKFGGSYRGSCTLMAEACRLLPLLPPADQKRQFALLLPILLRQQVAPAPTPRQTHNPRHPTTPPASPVLEMIPTPEMWVKICSNAYGMIASLDPSVRRDCLDAIDAIYQAEEQPFTSEAIIQFRGQALKSLGDAQAALARDAMSAEVEASMYS